MGFTGHNLRMKPYQFFRLDRVGVVDITGDDREAIVHNLTTNEIKSLEVDQGCETFVTDVRGKTLAHVMLYQLEDRIRMIGPHGPSTSVAEHVDRYTIREDAVAKVRDDDFCAIVLDAESAGKVLPDAVAKGSTARRVIEIGQQVVDAYTVPWLGDGTTVLLVESAKAESLAEQLVNSDVTEADEQAFHYRRIRSRFPWYGRDLDETNLPQEADRDASAISFTKGCYLGQETVARLDALGQVQKKLVCWKIENGDRTRRVETSEMRTQSDSAANDATDCETTAGKTAECETTASETTDCETVTGGITTRDDASADNCSHDSKARAGINVKAGDKLDADSKTVGRLTSVAVGDDGTIIAIGFARRSHFEAGSVAKGTDEVSGDVYTAIVSDCG
tara:strand:- start:7032 stop:8207 length:1176 start_codon:yes stop_codon:yes gene_type:complete